MPLAVCPDCTGKVSTSAAVCPHCGRPGPFAGAGEYAPQPVHAAVAGPPELECPVCRTRSHRSFCTRCDERMVPPGHLPRHQFPHVPVEYAGFGPRLGAMLIDLVVLLVPIALCIYIGATSPSGAVIGSLMNLLVVAGYQVGMHAVNGQTVGKRVVDIQVRRTDGSPIGFQEAFLRYLPYTAQATLTLLATIVAASALHTYDLEVAGGVFSRAEAVERLKPGWADVVSALGSLFVLADIVVFFVNGRRRALHDLIAETVVVHV